MPAPQNAPSVGACCSSVIFFDSIFKAEFSNADTQSWFVLFFSSFPRLSIKVDSSQKPTPRSGGAGVPYISHIGMCRPKGYSFWTFLVWERVYTLPHFGLESYMVFERTTWAYERIYRFIFQMNKHEMEICECEMHLKNYFVWALV